MLPSKIRAVRPKRPSRRRLVILLCILGGLSIVYLQQRTILDWWQLRGYTPPTVVAQIATEDTMTDYARKVFYVNKPAIEDKTAFTQCKVSKEKTIVLGCYRGNQNGIFVLDVTDARLNGVEQVTAAHEMLHAAYDRLSSSERSKIDTDLRNYFNNTLTDERIRKTIENYRTFEPNDLTNEMHSIFGTEIANLPASLEQYYQRYFTDRSKVVAYAAQYENEFTTRQDAIKVADAQLTDLKKQIEALKADLEIREQELKASSDRLQQLRSQGATEAYNAGVPAFNAKVNAYNAEIEQTRNLIEQYNALVAKRNAIVLEAQELSDEIDSTVAPMTKQ